MGADILPTSIPGPGKGLARICISDRKLLGFPKPQEVEAIGTGRLLRLVFYDCLNPTNLTAY